MQLLVELKRARRNDGNLRLHPMAESGAMSRSQVIRFVQRQRLGVVSSLAAGGAPQSAVVGIATSEAGEIVFDTLGTSRKAANLRRDPRAPLVVWENERTVQLEGLADEPTGAELDRLREVYFAVYPDGRDRLAWPSFTHFRIVPRWARFSDFEAAPRPVIVELDLTPGR
jgi:pyridoxine/pyridoxamine 5'-phosphate oxidase